MLKKPIFESFTEYWYFARTLSQKQRKIVFHSLSVEERQFLDNSYLKDGWSDLFYRNEIDEKLDELSEAYGYNILGIRAKALKRKSVYVPTKFWKIVEEQMHQYRPDVVKFVMSGLIASPCEKNPQVCLITYENNTSR